MCVISRRGSIFNSKIIFPYFKTQQFKTQQILGTDGYRPEKKFWVPMGTGYRENFHLCRLLMKTSIKLNEREGLTQTSISHNDQNE